MDNDADESPLVSSESEMKELLGLYDTPAFSRRGQDVEFALKVLHERCVREREERLDMVRMRLRQWRSVADGPDSALLVFKARICPLWPACGVPVPEEWCRTAPSPRKLREAARNLVGGVERFNARWTDFVSKIGVATVNRLIDQYNRYYLLEKECSLGSARLAARFFVPRTPVTPESLLDAYPLLPVPEPIRAS